MEEAMSQKRHLALTGPPGCGKTTVVKKFAELVSSELKLAGFYTQERRSQGQRVGFDAIGLATGQTVPLASVNVRSKLRVGRYGVVLDQFERLLHDELANEADVLVIDEIGKMECFSQEFITAIRRLLNGNVPMLMTVARRGSGLIAEVKNSPQVELWTVTVYNRDGLPQQVLTYFLRVLGHQH